MEKNLSEFLRDNLRTAWEGEDANFSSTDWRKQFFSKLCDSEEGKKIGLLTSKHQSLFHHQIKKIIKEKGQDPRSYGMSQPVKTFEQKGGQMQGVITPKPKPTDKKMGEMIPAQTQQTGQQGGMPQPAQDPQLQRVNFTQKTTGLTIKMMFNMLRLKFPALEGLDDDEVELLGEAWNPIFNRYLAGVAGMWMTALFTTGMVVTSKVADAKKKDPTFLSKKKEDKKVKNAIEKDNQTVTDESYQKEEPKNQADWLQEMGTDKADKRNKDK